MLTERAKLFKRPNDNILAAPAQATGGLKGVIAGTTRPIYLYLAPNLISVLI